MHGHVGDNHKITTTATPLARLAPFGRDPVAPVAMFSTSSVPPLLAVSRVLLGTSAGTSPYAAVVYPAEPEGRVVNVMRHR